MMNAKAAWGVALAMPAAAYVGVAAFFGPVAWNVRPAPGRERRAAVAVRDNVPAFQKWGTKQFTTPWLDRHYEATWYFTQTKTDDCRRAFVSCLDAALEQYPEVDLFLLAHSNHFIDWVKSIPPDRRPRLRLVYNSGCRDATQGPAWMNLGARAYIGHPGVSASPVFYFHFLRRWVRGAMLDDAVAEGNRRMERMLVRAGRVASRWMSVSTVYRNSVASIQGDGRLRIGGGAP